MKFFVALVALMALVSSGEGKVRVSVFYETLCPDSIRFITTQLTPTFVRLGGFGNAFLEIDFVPYGKALTFEDEEGAYTFQCQHGPDECSGNRMHSCALKHLPEASRAAFINCSMSASYPPNAGKSCSELLGLNFADVEQCSGSSEGNGLLAVNGNRTHSLDPTLYYVPWIMFDGVWSADDMYDAQQDLLEILCRKLGSQQSNECPQTSTTGASSTSTTRGLDPRLKAVRSDSSASGSGLLSLSVPSVVATLLNSRR